MPKHFREETDSLAEGLDGEWVGRCVMLKPAATSPRSPAASTHLLGREEVKGLSPQPHGASACPRL